MPKKRVRLTESQLRGIINESVRRVLNEETDDGYDEEYEKYLAAREKTYRRDPYGYRYRYDEETLAVEDAFIATEEALEEFLDGYNDTDSYTKNLMKYIKKFLELD